MARSVESGLDKSNPGKTTEVAGLSGCKMGDAVGGHERVPRERL